MSGLRRQAPGQVNATNQGAFEKGTQTALLRLVPGTRPSVLQRVQLLRPQAAERSSMQRGRQEHIPQGTPEM